MSEALSGVRVIEVAAWAFVPSAGAVLADWGADVIKVEHPEMGDPQRGLVSMGLIPGGPNAVNYIMEQPNRGKRSIGIDIEPTVELAPEMAVAILRADESSLDAHLAFSLKEAAYKAWSNIGGRMLGQHEVRLTLDHRNFLAEVIGEATAIRGTFAFAVDRCLAMAVIRA